MKEVSGKQFDCLINYLFAVGVAGDLDGRVGELAVHLGAGVAGAGPRGVQVRVAELQGKRV